MFLHKKRNRNLQKYTYFNGIVINGISNLKIVIISQGLTKRSCHILKMKICRSEFTVRIIFNMCILLRFYQMYVPICSLLHTLKIDNQTSNNAYVSSIVEPTFSFDLIYICPVNLLCWVNP